jgi:hypothetical protein
MGRRLPPLLFVLVLVTELSSGMRPVAWCYLGKLHVHAAGPYPADGSCISQWIDAEALPGRRAGSFANLLFVVPVPLMVFTVTDWVFGIVPGVLPSLTQQ